MDMDMSDVKGLIEEMPISICDTWSLENYGYDDESQKEFIDGETSFFKIKVSASAGHFDVSAHREADGEWHVPSDGYLGDEGSTGVDACPNYFALVQALLAEHFGMTFDEDDLVMADQLPTEVEVIDDALRARLTEFLKEQQAVAA